MRICPYCQQEARVIDTRDVVRRWPTRRRRLNCPQGHRWTTYEVTVEAYNQIAWDKVLSQPRERLTASIKYAGVGF